MTGSDRGLLLGDGLFETIPLHGGRPHALGLHLARFRSGARALGLAPPDEAELRRRVDAVLPSPRDRRESASPGVPDGRLRLTLTAGPGGAGGLARVPGVRPVLHVGAGPFRADPAWWSRGVTAVRVGRVDPDSLLGRSGAKHTNYLERILALEAAHREGAEEALLSTPAGHLVEGSSSALLWWDGRCLHLPPAGAGLLESLTVRLLREALAEAPGSRGTPPIITGDAPLDEDALATLLDGVGELLLASRLRQLVPVVAVDGRPVGFGEPGPVHRNLLALYRKRVEADLAR